MNMKDTILPKALMLQDVKHGWYDKDYSNLVVILQE